MAIHFLILVSMSFSSNIEMDMFGLTVPSPQALIIIFFSVYLQLPTWWQM